MQSIIKVSRWVSQILGQCEVIECGGDIVSRAQREFPSPPPRDRGLALPIPHFSYLKNSNFLIDLLWELNAIFLEEFWLHIQ